jgi:hypothetical protein
MVEPASRYLRHQESGRTFQVTTAIEVASEWIGLMGKRAEGVVGSEHAWFIPRENGVYIRAGVGKTYLNGRLLKPEEELPLRDNSVVVLGHKTRGAIFVFKDIVQKNRQMDTRRINAVRFDFTVLKNAAERMNRELFNKAPATLREFSQYLLDFVFAKFRVQRGVVYRVEEKRLIPLAARAMSSSFRPPRLVLNKVWEKKEPCRFELPEAEETGDISKSIVEGHVQSAICFPLINKGEMIGMLYIDTQKETVRLSEDDLVILCTLMPGVSGYMRVLLTYENERIAVDQHIKALFPVSACEVPGYKLDSFLVSKGISFFSYPFTRDGTLFFVCGNQKPRGTDSKDFLLQATSIGSTLGILSQHKLTMENMRKAISAVHEHMQGKFPSLRQGFAIGSFRNGKLVFAGYGGIYCVVKPPERDAFIVFVEEEFDAEVIFALDYPCPNNTYFVMTCEDPEKLCTLFNRIKNDARVKEDLRKLPGVLYCKIEKLEGGDDAG